MEYLVPSKTLFREDIQNKDSFLSDIGPKGDGGRFWKEREWGHFFIWKVIVQTHFSWWEPLPMPMPGMQSLKALLLFVKEQWGFLPPLYHHRSCVLNPLKKKLLIDSLLIVRIRVSVKHSLLWDAMLINWTFPFITMLNFLNLKIITILESLKFSEIHVF